MPLDRTTNLFTTIEEANKSSLTEAVEKKAQVFDDNENVFLTILSNNYQFIRLWRCGKRLPSPGLVWTATFKCLHDRVNMQSKLGHFWITGGGMNQGGNPSCLGNKIACPLCWFSLRLGMCTIATKKHLLVKTNAHNLTIIWLSSVPTMFFTMTIEQYRKYGNVTETEPQILTLDWEWLEIYFPFHGDR